MIFPTGTAAAKKPDTEVKTEKERDGIAEDVKLKLKFKQTSCLMLTGA